MKTTHLTAEKKLNLFPGYDTQLFSGTNIMVSRVTAAANADAPTHSHPHEQLSVVIKGEIAMTVGDERIVLEAGDALSIPGGVPHSGRTLTECEILEIFTPVRDDLLQRLQALP